MMNEEKKLTDEEIVKNLISYKNAAEIDGFVQVTSKQMSIWVDLIYRLHKKNTYLNKQPARNSLYNNESMVSCNLVTCYNENADLKAKNAELQKQINEFQEKIKQGTLIDTTKYFIRTEEYKYCQTRYLICKYGAHTDVYNFYTDEEKAQRDLEMIYNV